LVPNVEARDLDDLQSCEPRRDVASGASAATWLDVGAVMVPASARHSKRVAPILASRP
jgi:hypothetical protein